MNASTDDDRDVDGVTSASPLSAGDSNKLDSMLDDFLGNLDPHKSVKEKAPKPTDNESDKK